MFGAVAGCASQPNQVSANVTRTNTNDAGEQSTFDRVTKVVEMVRVWLRRSIGYLLVGPGVVSRDVHCKRQCSDDRFWSDRFRLFGKKSQMGASRSRTTVPETFAMVDGRRVEVVGARTLDRRRPMPTSRDALLPILTPLVDGHADGGGRRGDLRAADSETSPDGRWLLGLRLVKATRGPSRCRLY